jgi:hypothetical protein
LEGEDKPNEFVKGQSAFPSMLDSNLTSKPDQVDESHPVQITFPSEVVFNDGEK